MKGPVGMRVLTALTAFALAVVAFLACGSGDADRTGIAEVDRVIEAVEAEDIQTLAGMVTYFEQPCGPPGGIPSPPQCPEGEPDGTPVDVWWSATCEGYYVSRAETESHIMGRVEDVGLRLYAVYRDGSQLGFDADYVILFSHLGPNELLVGQSVALSGGRIQSWTTICGPIESGATRLEDGGAEALIEPRDD